MSLKYNFILKYKNTLNAHEFKSAINFISISSKPWIEIGHLRGIVQFLRTIFNGIATVDGKISIDAKIFEIFVIGISSGLKNSLAWLTLITNLNNLSEFL